jgi:GT2 family glycosyltransferase
MSRLSIIIVNYNTRGLLLDCLRSLRAFPPAGPWEVIVIDNGSSDGSVEAVRAEFPETMLIANPTNCGFSAANNQGLERATGDYLLLLNSDSKVTAGALDGLVEFMEQNPDSAAAAPMLLNSDGTLQRSFFQFPSAGKAFLHILGVSRVLLRLLRRRGFRTLVGHVAGSTLYTQPFDASQPQRVAYVLFACILLRRRTLERIGLLDEGLFFYHEDCEFGYRLAKAGLALWWLPSCKVVHIGGASSDPVASKSFRYYYESLLKVFKKHETWLSRLILRLAIAAGFLFRAAVTSFGAYKRLRIPTTYARTGPSQEPPFASTWGRVCYYSSLAALAWRK